MLRQLIAQRSLIRGGGGHHYKGYNEPGGHFLGIPVRTDVFSAFRLINFSISRLHLE